MKKGRVFHTPLFIIRILKDQVLDTRIAAVSPKKIAKTAVIRNKIRRKIYESVKSFKKSINSPIHVILFAKSGIIEARTEDIKSDLTSFFVKIGILG